MLEITKFIVSDCLTVDKLIDAIHKIKDSINLHFPEPVENETKGSDDPWDWDSLYYIARYHLHMTDSEFMDCTPRRFHKLNYLWRVENGLVSAKPKEAFIDEIMF